MKKNVKIVSILIICILLCGVMIACGPKTEEKVSEPAADGGDVVVDDAAAEDTASVEGKWAIDNMIDAEGTLTGKEIVAEFGEMYYEFNADGKFVGTIAGQGIEGTWEQTGTGVKITINGVVTEGTVEGDTLTLVSDGATSVFTRV